MEDDPSYRQKVHDYLYSTDDSSDVSNKKKVSVDKINNNVITVNFNRDNK